ncbi:MAG: SDR family oxidoreductase [Desulfobacterales bacterium]|nr:SDR family oxidoreductase [Desulfobacterales bacterium]
MRPSAPILVTGATGYVGGRLIPALLQAGYRVRAMGRSVEKLADRPWAGHPGVELVRGDALDPASLQAAAAGCEVAYYLVHSMIAQKGRFAEADRAAARNMVAAAEAAGLRRIIYLGGLAESKHGDLSEHLSSRIEVARILQSGRVPATDLRAPMILGSGSASFEILRYLVEHLPVMTTPRWVRSLNQPIAITNVIGYLVGCLERPETSGQVYDVGGPDVLTYQRLLEIYAETAGLRKRVIIPVPVLTPTLSAYWIRFVSPVPAAIALPLTEGLTSDAVCRDNRIRDVVPQRLLGCREAIGRALERVQQERLASCWSADGELMPFEWPYRGDADYAGGTRFICAYRAPATGTAEELWRPVARIGGRNGYYFADSLWRLRGAIDRLCGGRGLGPGRAGQPELRPGDRFDFWRVLETDPPHRLGLLSEMKAPGHALLDILLTPRGPNRCEIRLVSRFLPRGLAGLLYWAALLPLHRAVFKGLVREIARRAGRELVERPRPFTPDERDLCSLPPC